ncbi:hypothetical protein GE061_003861 [Apolygus lucorum]|uniref:Amino acid transporter transmembrane domain-containing protein n=1 Tax=Apolygus lucorum TaxID=248454 RepID=A0A6A4IRJ1_APOLU|nr:hypothetical protein GE061_003861 [Apolygus lucorum]
MSNQEEEPKKEAEKADSVEKRSEDEEYDPYKYRDGHLGTSIAFFHLVKSSIGAGILSMPFGFKTTGMIAGFIVGISVAAFVIFSFLVMIKTMVKVAKELKVPHVTLQEAAAYVMEHSCERAAKYSKTLEITIDAMLILNYVGTCASYYNYIIICTLTISGYKQYAEGAVNSYRAVAAGLWFLPLFSVNCVRGLRKMAPISILGNVLIMGSMIVVCYFIFKPDSKGFSDTWTYFATFETTPLFVGMMVFSIGSIGVGIAIERDMKNARKFGGLLGIYNVSMTFVVIVYLFIACVGYWKYGEDTRSTIVLTLQSDSFEWLVIFVQVAVGFALFLSYPLMCFVLFDIVWFNKIIPKLEEKNMGKKKQLMWEYLFRLGITALTGVVALLVPRLDVTLSLIGALALGFLSLIMPGILEFNFTYGKHQWRKPLVLYKDIGIMVIGFLCLMIGTYSALYSLIIESQKGPPEEADNSTALFDEFSF